MREVKTRSRGGSEKGKERKRVETTAEIGRIVGRKDCIKGKRKAREFKTRYKKERKKKERQEENREWWGISL